MRLGDRLGNARGRIAGSAKPLLKANKVEADIVLVLLAAGKGTRFGDNPKCASMVGGKPLARHTVDSFRQCLRNRADESASKAERAGVVAAVGHRESDVMAAIGPEVLFIRSENPAGGTAFAAFEALGAPGLLESNPLVVIAMGDRIVPESVLARLLAEHRAGEREADLTFLTAQYLPPKQRGKGRIRRDRTGRVFSIVEERDLPPGEVEEEAARGELVEGNCPLYAARAAVLDEMLRDLTNDNAQEQYYLTDIVSGIALRGGDIRTVSTAPGEPGYSVLIADVTRPPDLAHLEELLAAADAASQTTSESLDPASAAPESPEDLDAQQIEAAAKDIERDRPTGQIASIAAQLRELHSRASGDNLGFAPTEAISIGFSGGRFRIAFMHPDMGRFFGPAWQMPIGARDVSGAEQIVVLAQAADDRLIHLHPLDPNYREKLDALPSDVDAMFPGEDVSDWHSYEGFGTHMSESLLMSLGYFTDEELEARRARHLPLPPPSLWIGSNMRRPFALVGNAIASIRTLREGEVGAKIQARLGRSGFTGLRLAMTGNIPRGGFSSSSAVTLATKNALNALFEFGISSDTIIHLACQAEYGTGVRAGSLDQSTEQKGCAGVGTLISSNPADSYQILGNYPVPSDRFRVIFPYSAERDREAWRWSWGLYARAPVPGGPLTAGEFRKMTGKSAEFAAHLVALPHGVDFFKVIESDLLDDGALESRNRAWICGILRQLPQRISLAELKRQLNGRLVAYAEEIAAKEKLALEAARKKATANFASLFEGWREPVLLSRDTDGHLIRKKGLPLRAMAAYLFAEVAKNFRLIQEPERWIEWVTCSQAGDRCFEIDFRRLPSRSAMEGELAWERSTSGPERMELWFRKFGALPFDFDGGLDDDSLESLPEIHDLPGTNFFRGLALIDLAEAMLKRAFAPDAVAVRVNAAGQGDYFQVHIDLEKADPEEVKAFLRKAFYRRFDIAVSPEFVELYPGGPAGGVRLPRYELLPQLAERLEAGSGDG